jgi:hypothetical protein
MGRPAHEEKTEMTTATTSVDTADKATAITYTTVVTNVEAPTDANGNRKIRIHVDHRARKASFACVSFQHVGCHKQRKVEFTANDFCTLIFDNQEVFGIVNVDLSKGVPKSLEIQDSTTGVDTGYAITKPGTAITEEQTNGGQQLMGPPRIVVP